MTTNEETVGTSTLTGRVAGWFALPEGGVIATETEDWPLGAEGWIDASARGGESARYLPQRPA